jgi:hypothetical protein
MYSNVFENVKTKDDLYRLKEGLDKLDSAYYKNPGLRFSDKPIENLSLDFYSQLAQLVESYGLEKVIFDLRKEIELHKEIKFTLAFEPASGLAKTICTWVKEKLGERIVIDFDVDKSILCGFVIVYEGRVIDKSLKKPVEEWINTNYSRLFELEK